MDNNEIVDLSYVIELAGDKPDYIQQVLSIFMESTPPGLKELENLIRNTNDWEAISKQAHFLKSGVGIVKIKGMLERLQQIETRSKEQKDKDVIIGLLDETIEIFSKAELIIKEQMENIS